MQALARMSDLDIVQITERALGYPLPQFQHLAPKSIDPLGQERNLNDSKKLEYPSAKLS